MDEKSQILELRGTVLDYRQAYDEVARMEWSAADAATEAAARQKAAKTDEEREAASEVWRDSERMADEFREAQDALAQQLAELAQKALADPDLVDGIVYAIREAEAREPVLKREADLLARRSRGEGRLVDQLKSATRDLLEASGEKVANGQVHRLQLQQASSPSVTLLVDEQAAVEAGYGVTKTVYQPDKRAIAAAWKADPTSVAELADVRIGQYVRIY